MFAAFRKENEAIRWQLADSLSRVTSERAGGAVNHRTAALLNRES